MPMLMEVFLSCLLFPSSGLLCSIHPEAFGRKTGRNYTVSAIVKELNKIEAVIDYKIGQYSSRYKLTAKQKAILSCLALSENDVDEFAKYISSSHKL